MPLLLDIGNTHTRVAWYDDNGGLSVSGIMPTGNIKELRLPEHGAIALCSVVPEITDFFRNTPGVFILEAASYCGGMPVEVDRETLGRSPSCQSATALASLSLPRVSRSTSTGIPPQYVALWHDGDLPAVSIDCGTAVTMEFVTGSGFAGGAILPGRKLQRCALASGTAQLHDYPLSRQKPFAAGTNTADAVAAGIDLGCVGAVERIIADWESEKQGKCKCIFTGGDAEFFAGIFRDKSITDPLLTLRGVFEAWRESCV